MLDYFCIFTKSGALLWALSLTTVKGEPVNALIRECLLEERTGDTTFSYTSPSGAAYNLKWALNNVRSYWQESSLEASSTAGLRFR